MTLFDEAELATAVKGMHVVGDIVLGGFDNYAVNDGVEQLNNFRVEVIPKNLLAARRQILLLIFVWPAGFSFTVGCFYGSV